MEVKKAFLVDIYEYGIMVILFLFILFNNNSILFLIRKNPLVSV